jgi:hypothetical protein
MECNGNNEKAKGKQSGEDKNLESRWIESGGMQKDDARMKVIAMKSLDHKLDSMDGAKK